MNIQKELGYVFKDPSLIQTAFIHKSYEGSGKENNTRLVFLGHHLVEFVLCDYIYSRFPYTDEKQLQYQLDSHINALNPGDYIKEHSLSGYICLSSLCEIMRESDSLCREIFFAVTAAIYKDGGLPSLKSFILPIIRSCGGESYRPHSEGKVIISEEKNEGPQHIKNARLRKHIKSSAISISKAETVNNNSGTGTEERLEKTKKGIAGLLSKKFIRDALAPVRLSEELRNTDTKNTGKTRISVQDGDENFKSLLQELVQKNIRTPNVILKYTAAKQKNGEYTAEVILDGKIMGKAVSQNKKSAEKNAAKTAYLALTDVSSEEYRHFSAISRDGVANVETSEDYISKLNRHFQKIKHSSNTPVKYEKKDSGKRGQYIVSVTVDGKEIAWGQASSLKEARQNAAKAACKELGI